jgi:DNA-binding NarL/FixJ family response regulator
MSDLPIRVAVISRNHIVRAGLVNLVAQLHQRAVVTEAATVDTGLGHHDVAIYDLDAVEDASAYEELQHLLDTGTQVIGLIYDKLRETIPAAAGATSHLITLSVTPEQLLAVLERATSARQPYQVDAVEVQLPGGLTEREFRVIAMIGECLSNRQIAKDLFVSDNTVKTNIRMANRKLGVDSRSAAMLWALEHGLAGGPDRR